MGIQLALLQGPVFASPLDATKPGLYLSNISLALLLESWHAESESILEVMEVISLLQISKKKKKLSWLIVIIWNRVNNKWVTEITY